MYLNFDGGHTIVSMCQNSWIIHERWQVDGDTCSHCIPRRLQCHQEMSLFLLDYGSRLYKIFHDTQRCFVRCIIASVGGLPSVFSVKQIGSSMCMELWSSMPGKVLQSCNLANTRVVLVCGWGLSTSTRRQQSLEAVKVFSKTTRFKVLLHPACSGNPWSLAGRGRKKVGIRNNFTRVMRIKRKDTRKTLSTVPGTRSMLPLSKVTGGTHAAVWEGTLHE